MEFYQETLTMIRDGRFMIVGYLLFALLAAMGVQLLRLIIKGEDRWASYGACQKTLILMFVFELNIHYLSLSSRTVQFRGRFRYTESAGNE